MSTPQPATALTGDSAPAPEPRGVPIDCIQPGGGTFFTIEAAFGRLRRKWLRLARPGYVRDMQRKRQGDCPGCPHDIIDARDLKLWRNVCGFGFKPEDDPFRWREGVRFARAGLCEVVVMGLLSAAVVAGCLALVGAHRWLLAPAALAVVHWLFVLWFFRDPHRAIADDATALLSPADGVVTHVEEVDLPHFPGGRAFRISLWLSPLNVHLNRAPRHARVVSTRYFPGRFVNARRADSARINEQLWVDFVEPNGRRFRVIQISGSLARRLVCWVKPGEEVRAGERYGMIKYGSRCDILVPTGEAWEPAVKRGDKVGAGISVLLRYRENYGKPNAPRG